MTKPLSHYRVTPQILAAIMLADQKPMPSDFAVAREAIALLPFTSNRDALNVLAECARDLRLAAYLSAPSPAPMSEEAS